MLVGNGFAVTGYELDEDRRRKAEALGVTLAANPLDVLRTCEVVVFSLPTVRLSPPVAASSGASFHAASSITISASAASARKIACQPRQPGAATSSPPRQQRSADRCEGAGHRQPRECACLGGGREEPWDHRQRLRRQGCGPDRLQHSRAPTTQRPWRESGQKRAHQEQRAAHAEDAPPPKAVAGPPRWQQHHHDQTRVRPV